MLYRDNGRKLVLALKHGDRHEIVRPASLWMAQAAQEIRDDNMILVPIPLHWTRMIRRRFNQSALLAGAVAERLGLPWCPDALVRPTRTRSLDGMGFDGRFETMSNALAINTRQGRRLEGLTVLLVDDVMTSGATLSVGTQACFRAGAADVRTLVLARVAKDD